MRTRLGRNQRRLDDGTVQTIYWQAIGPREAVQWIEYERGGETQVQGPTGLVSYQGSEGADRIDADYLRSIPIGRQMPHRNGYAEFQQIDAPGVAQLDKAWLDERAVRQRKIGEAKALLFAPRTEDESPDDFYARVADFYLRAMASSGEPTKMLATVADVPKTTAARWVREARARGHLDPTTRGRRFA